MTCYSPLQAWRIPSDVPFKFSITFKVREGERNGLPLKLPCGRCIGCRLDRSRQWATRCVHEAQLHARTSFLTLTYRDSDLPPDRSISVREMQLFMKRLRREYGEGIRVFYCGEYGEHTGRPHYHACIFGEDFKSDAKPWRKTDLGHILYNSNILTELWGKGHAVIGSLTFESAAYVSRYITKKVLGKGSEDAYRRVDPQTGEIFQLFPEYCQMSRRPGIAADWFSKFWSDVYPSDQVIIRGFPCRPPRYYDKLLSVLDPYLWDDVKEAREKKVRENPNYFVDNTPERLQVRMRVKAAQLKRLVRALE